jgi:YggT family protein
LTEPVQFLPYWYFHVPNYILAVLMYSLLARFVLALVFSADTSNYIYRAFVRLTDPVLAAVRFVTPRAVSPLLVILLGVVWLIAFRFALLAGFAAAGLAPTLAR